MMIDNEYESPLKEVTGSIILGTQDFVDFIKDKSLAKIIKKFEKKLSIIKV